MKTAPEQGTDKPAYDHGAQTVKEGGDEKHACTKLDKEEGQPQLYPTPPYPLFLGSIGNHKLIGSGLDHSFHLSAPMERLIGLISPIGFIGPIGSIGSFMKTRLPET